MSILSSRWTAKDLPKSSPNSATVAVIEEHSCIGGLGAQLKQLAWDVRANCILKTFSLKDEFIHFYGNQRELWTAHGLDESIIYRELAALK